MEDSSSSNIEPEPQFFCHLCSISCASALNLQSHFLGMKHRKVEEAVRNNTTGENKTDDEEQIFVKPNATLQEQVDACKNSEPALGLEYIYQYKKHGFNTYECKLCECRSGLTHMFMHIVGAKHRITYLSKHHPSLGISGPYIMKGPKKLRKLRETCLTVEKEFGRQKINVMEGMESEWSFSTDISGASSVYYNPDSEQEHLDFTTDDFFDTDDKPAASEHDVTFLDLKSAHEASQKAAESSDCISQTAEESEEGKHKKDTENEESKKDIHEKEVHSKEPCESGPNFTNTEELLDFLEHFRILEITDAKFVITVVEMLSIAVVRYKTACKENNKKDLSVSKSHATNKPGKCKKQDPKPSVVQPQAKQGPVSEFNSTSPPGETKPPVPSSSSSMPRVSTIKSKEIPLLSDPLLNNQVSIDQPGSSSATTPDQSLGPERKSPEKLFPVSKPNNTGRLGERKKLMFTVSSNKAQEAKSNKKQESHGPTANYIAATNVFNQDKREDSKSPREIQQLHGLQGGVISSVGNMTQALQNPVYSGAPFTQTRFAPPGAPFPPRAAPPLFPIAKDDIINKFFDSIKNMEVNEVISTLNKITATNPAFKGIHVPSLIRYLTETGKLKSAQSMQQLNP